jgi:hypothetical protein
MIAPEVEATKASPVEHEKEITESLLLGIH